jgi:hypothetical protein
MTYSSSTFVNIFGTATQHERVLNVKLNGPGLPQEARKYVRTNIGNFVNLLCSDLKNLLQNSIYWTSYKTTFKMNLKVRLAGKEQKKYFTFNKQCDFLF